MPYSACLAGPTLRRPTSTKVHVHVHKPAVQRVRGTTLLFAARSACNSLQRTTPGVPADFTYRQGPGCVRPANPLKNERSACATTTNAQPASEATSSGPFLPEGVAGGPYLLPPTWPGQAAPAARTRRSWAPVSSVCMRALRGSPPLRPGAHLRLLERREVYAFLGTKTSHTRGQPA